MPLTLPVQSDLPDPYCVVVPGVSIPLPAALTVSVSRLRADPDLRSAGSSGVDYLAHGIPGVDVLVCNVTISWHVDSDVPPYVALYVVRNDGGSYVEAEGVLVVPDQPPGTLVLLGSRQAHRLWHPAGVEAPDRVWAAVALDFHSPPTPEQAVEAIRAKF